MLKRNYVSISENTNNNQVLIRRQDVPEYLKTGAYYRSLADDEDDDTIMVPGNTLKPDPIVNSAADVYPLFESLRFWIVDEIPVSFLEFVFTQHRLLPSYDAFWNKFKHEFPWLNALECCVSASIKLNTTRMQRLIRHGGGNIELIKAAYPLLRCMPSNACELAVITGNIEYFQFIHKLSKRKVLSKMVCSNIVVYRGDVALLAAAYDLGYRWESNLSSVAARAGTMSCLKFIHEHGGLLDGDEEEEDTICDVAAARGHIACLEYLREHGCPWDSFTCSSAICGNQLACLQYLHEHGCPWNTNVCTTAAREGRLQCLQYLHQHGCPWDAATSFAAAYRGHLSCLQYAHENGCIWDDRDCMEIASSCGHINCLQYLHQQGCEWNVSACISAARNGELSCLKYLHTQGCEWDETVCAAAAGGGHIQCLQYLHEHGCPWDTNTCKKAAGWCDLDCLQYAHEHGCPWDTSTCTAAADSGQFDTLKYAHEHGCPWESSAYMRVVVSGYSLHCIQYLHEHGCVVNSATVQQAKVHPWSTCAKYILQHYAPEDLQAPDDSL